MKKMSAKKSLIGMILLPALFYTGTVLAHETEGPHDHDNDVLKAEAYGVDDRGTIWRSTSSLGGHCWRTNYWTPAMAIFECDPDLVKQPEIVAEAPPPAPTPPEKITFSADALFDFDSATLKPQGAQALDEFANGLQGVQYDLIIAVGYADRIGAPDYNQRLSLRRAESVKAHLVSRGIDANQIFTDGKGEANPVTGGTCTGGGQALKDCLAPDRRVEIEVAGTR
ncbi:MAG: OmpA family protein [Betaproteobacteria bacterium]|nr:OmpA family protein [Betaproteobacteria bacterium]